MDSRHRGEVNCVTEKWNTKPDPAPKSDPFSGRLTPHAEGQSRSARASLGRRRGARLEEASLTVVAPGDTLDRTAARKA